MTTEIILLASTAASLGFIHTIFGPDHYLPFIVLSRARQWSLAKTVMITALCGVGHVLSSVILGFAGIALGIAVFDLQAIEAFRGEIAAWLLIIFGFTYFIWGMVLIFRKKPHQHVHSHGESMSHSHVHSHVGNHLHIHTSDKRELTPWVLFIIFIFGPCEPLIPLVMYPAASNNWLAVTVVSLVFSLMTIVTMVAIVVTLSLGFVKLSPNGIGRYAHALAGLIILFCGGAIKFLGL